MERRALLRRAALVGPLALAGCISSSTEASDPADDTPDSSDERTPTATPASERAPTHVDTTFEVRSHTGGTEAPRANVEFDTDAGEVVVHGIIQGSDGCKTAELGGVEYDDEADEVTIAVATADRVGTEGRACSQALVDIGYRVVAHFEGGLPQIASVVHDGAEVVSAAYGSASASPPSSDDG